MVWFYTALFAIPSLATFLWCGGKTQLSREDLLKSEVAQAKLRERGGNPEAADIVEERKAAMQRVMFDTKGDMRQDWAIKRDEAKNRAAADNESRPGYS
mgnify:CR=1 FL=1|jgi:hypothetical protein